MILKGIALLSLLVFGFKVNGYLLDPPSRDSFANDTSTDCGGLRVHHFQNGGKCGVCGEDYSKADKILEPGPANKYATGTIVANYNEGETIDVTVVLNAFYNGHFEFRLCENDIPQQGKDASVAVTLSCFSKHLLKSPNGDTEFPAKSGKTTHKVKLPDQVTCKACVLQWRYKTEKYHGCEDDQCGDGVGPQDELVGCADVAIKSSINNQQTSSPISSNGQSNNGNGQSNNGNGQSNNGNLLINPTKGAPTTRKQKLPSTTDLLTTDELPTTKDLPTKDRSTKDLSTTKDLPIVTDIPTKTDLPTTELPTTTKLPAKITDLPTTTDLPTKAKSPKTVKVATTMKSLKTQKTSTLSKALRTTKKPTAMKIIPTKPKPVVKKPVKPKKRVCRGRAPYGRRYDSFCKTNCNWVRRFCPPSHCIC